MDLIIHIIKQKYSVGI